MFDSICRDGKSELNEQATRKWQFITIIFRHSRMLNLTLTDCIHVVKHTACLINSAAAFCNHEHKMITTTITTTTIRLIERQDI